LPYELKTLRNAWIANNNVWEFQLWVVTLWCVRLAMRAGFVLGSSSANLQVPPLTDDNFLTNLFYVQDGLIEGMTFHFKVCFFILTCM